MNWDNYYERRPSIEGIAGTFDLFGENSSFHFPRCRQSETGYVRYTIGNNFQKVGRYLLLAMNCYGEIQKSRKS